MMQAFRNSAKPVVYLITITFMIWMVFDLSGLSGSGGMFSRTSIGSVDGQSVDTRSYQEAVQNAISQRQQQTSGALTLKETEEVRDQVWESFVQQAVLNKAIKEQHLTAQPAEIASLLREIPPQEVQQAPDFQTDGKFDLTKYQRWLTSPVGKQYVPVLEARYRGEILRAKLLRNVTADIYLSDAALWRRYRDQNETVTIGLTPLVPSRVIADSAVSVTEAQIEAYYRAHPDDFNRPETAFLSYIALPRGLDASDSAAALQHTLDVRKEIEGGAPFAEVARRESTDPGSAQQGGDLGTFGRGELVEPVEKAAFSLPLNVLSQPILSTFGYHLIEVTGRTADSVTARHILIPIELAGKHRDLVDAEADSLEQLGADRLDPAALDTAARALNLPIGQAAPLQQGSGGALVGPYMVADASVWAFQAQQGETSPVIETEQFDYVFRLDSLHKAGVPPLAAITGAVRSAVMDSVKRVLAVAKADTLIARVRSGEQLADASTAMGLQHRRFGPFARIQPPLPNPKLIGTAFGLPVGSVSEPIVTTEGIYVIHVIAHQQADSTEFRKNIDQFRAQEVRAARDQRVRYYLASLRKNADITDRRAEIYKTAAQTDAEVANQQQQLQ